MIICNQDEIHGSNQKEKDVMWFQDSHQHDYMYQKPKLWVDSDSWDLSRAQWCHGAMGKDRVGQKKKRRLVAREIAQEMRRCMEFCRVAERGV